LQARTRLLLFCRLKVQVKIEDLWSKKGKNYHLFARMMTNYYFKVKEMNVLLLRIFKMYRTCKISKIVAMKQATMLEGCMVAK
jgi:hypothetical protein